MAKGDSEYVDLIVKYIADNSMGDKDKYGGYKDRDE